MVDALGKVILIDFQRLGDGSCSCLQQLLDARSHGRKVSASPAF